MPDIPKTRDDIKALITGAMREVGNDKTSEAVATVILDRFATITPPSQDVSIGLVIAGVSGGPHGQGGGVSIKPGNIVLNWRRLIFDGSEIAVATKELGHPLTAVFAALIIWNKVWSLLAIQISERHAALLLAMWLHRDTRSNVVRKEGLPSIVNQELAKWGKPPIAIDELETLLMDLERLECIELAEGDWWMREWIRKRTR
jgi:hypothetical protein